MRHLDAAMLRHTFLKGVATGLGIAYLCFLFFGV
jgi:hypothetical protein